jgi:hypothetical protein
MLCSGFIFDHIVGEINSTHGNDIRATSDILIVLAFSGAIFRVGIYSTLDRCTMKCQQRRRLGEAGGARGRRELEGLVGVGERAAEPWLLSSSVESSTASPESMTLADEEESVVGEALMLDDLVVCKRDLAVGVLDRQPTKGSTRSR